MKILILNSGIGSRLKPLTNKIPKCLLKINEKSIIEYQLESFSSFGLTKFIITTGFLDSKLRNFVQKRFSNLDIKFVYNPKFEITNYIYSIWLTKRLIDEDIILIHGDLIFEAEILNKILNQQKNSVLVDSKTDLPKKDFKCLIRENRIKKIGVDIFDKDAFPLLPVYYWKEKDFLRWIDEMEKFIKEGRTNCYAEDAFNKISDEIYLFPIFFNNLLCMEIDTINDLNLARRYLK